MHTLLPYIIGVVLLLAPLHVRAQVVISEVLWMGSDASSADEWLELAVRCGSNEVCQDVDVSGWSLKYLNSSGIDTVMFSLPQGTTVSTLHPLVIARKDAAASRLLQEPGVVSSSVSLPNTKLLLKLWTASGMLVDTVDDGVGAPFAGQNPSGGAKASMERIDLLAPGNDAANWRTATESTGFDDGSAMFGTPGTLPPAPSEPASGTGSTLLPLQDDAGSGEILAVPQAAEPPLAEVHVLLSGVLANPKGKDELGEWVELHNLSDSPVLLTGWSLVGKGNTVKTASLGGIRLAERSKTRLLYADTQLLLTNTKYTVSLVDPLGAEVSAVSWEDAAEDRVYKPNVFTELTMHATVSRVIDGDTVEVVFDTEPAPDGSPLATVRLLGVDAPESVHPTRPVEPYGMEASNALKSLLEKKKVELQFDTTNWDAYGRLLAYVRVDEQVLAQERLLSTGLARVYPDFPFARRGMFDDYEARAKALKLGMWSLPPSHVQYSLALPPALATDVRMEAQPTLSPSGSTSPALSGSDIVSMGWNTLSISEVYAHPKKGDAEWIELFNPGPTTVHLHGLRLRIGQGPKAKLVRFPDGVVAAGGRIVFSDADMKLTLRDTGNMLSLVGTGSVALHAMEYPKLKAGQAWVSEADMECLSTETTPGEPGTCTLAATGAALQEGGVVRALAQASNASPKKVPASRARAGSSPYSQQVLSSLAFPAYAPPTTLPAPSGAGPWQVFTFLLACVSLIQGTLFCVIAWKSGLLTAAVKLRVG